MKYYRIRNHAMERESIAAVPEEDDEYSPHRYNKTEEDRIHDMREKANIEVTEIEIEEK